MESRESLERDWPFTLDNMAKEGRRTLSAGETVTRKEMAIQGPRFKDSLVHALSYSLNYSHPSIEASIFNNI